MCTLSLVRSAAPASQRGMVLIVVLWMLAALSLFAANLGSLVRDQAQQISVQRHLVQGKATGQAAIYLALLTLAKENRRPEVESLAVNFSDQTVAVQFQPWSGLVNINQASAAVWKSLLQGAGGLGAQQANQLAQTIVDFREQLRQQQGRVFAQPWDTAQDVLQVPGLGYSTYTKLQPYLVASAKKTSTIAQPMAPPELAQWLQAYAPEQLRSSPDNDGLYTVTAWVPVQDGTVRVQCHMAWQSQPATGLPWTLLASTAIWQPR